jgi:predicted PurR-regulated permease PerM
MVTMIFKPIRLLQIVAFGAVLFWVGSLFPEQWTIFVTAAITPFVTYPLVESWRRKDLDRNSGDDK